MANNLIPSIDNSSELNNTLFVLFKLGDKHYAIHSSHTIEVLKLPQLEYPQKLPKHIIGILNYNGLTINVVDIRSVLNLELLNCSINDQLIVVRTEEAIFGIVVNDVVDVLSIPSEDMQATPYMTENHVIKLIYKMDTDLVSILDLYSVENILKGNEFVESDRDYEKLFPSDEKSKQILRKRSEKLAVKSADNLILGSYSQDQFILFDLGQSTYCINIKFVKELVSTANIKITPLPFTPEYISGVINLRGSFITIVDLKKLLNIDEKSYSSSAKILVFDSKDYKIAVLVDEISSVKNLDADSFVHHANSKFESRYTMAEVVEGKKVYHVLNAEKVINDEKLFINIES